MLTRKIQLPSVINPNPGAGQTATIIVPGGERVHQILLKISCSGSPTTLPTVGSGGIPNVGDIRVKLGGKVQRLHSAAELNKLNKVNGSGYGAYTIGTSGAAGYGQIIPIFFAEPWRNNNAEGEFLAVETSKDRLMEIEVDLTSVATGGTAMSVSAQAVVDQGRQPRNSGVPFVMKKVFRSDFPTSTALDITTLDKRDMYSAIHIVSGTASNITKAVLKADGLPIHELLVAENSALLTQNQQDPTQFDYSIVMDQDDPMANGLFAGGLSDLQLRVEQSVTATTRTLSERIGAPE